MIRPGIPNVKTIAIIGMNRANPSSILILLSRLYVFVFQAFKCECVLLSTCYDLITEFKVSNPSLTLPPAKSGINSGEGTVQL
jgi:hypothetical protein